MLEGTSSFLVPRDTPGLEVARCNETVGGRYMNNGEIVFDDCRVPEDHLLAHGDALGKAGVYFRPGKIIQAAKNLGIGIAAFEDTAALVQQRRPGRADPHQAPGGGAAGGRYGDEARSGERSRCGTRPSPSTSTAPMQPACATW